MADLDNKLFVLMRPDLATGVTSKTSLSSATSFPLGVEGLEEGRGTSTAAIDVFVVFTELPVALLILAATHDGGVDS